MKLTGNTYEPSTDDLNRSWTSKVKVTACHRGVKDVHVDAVVVMSIFWFAIAVVVLLPIDITSVVTTTNLSSPSRWLATIEPELPSRCCTMFLAVFLVMFLANCPSRPAVPCASAPPLYNDRTAVQQRLSRHCS